MNAANAPSRNPQAQADTPLPTVIVLASGRGDRFRASGGEVYKLQALLAGRSVLERTLAAVRSSGLPWHLEDAGHPGMGDSIAAGVRATQDANGWLILPGDLPLVQAATLQRVAHALIDPERNMHTAHAVQPQTRCDGELRRGHPVGFSAGCRAALLELEGNQGAAPVVRSLAAINCVAWLEVDDIGVVTDIDTLDDLARAEARWLARS